MMEAIIIGGWAVGMIGYAILGKAYRYNNRTYFDVRGNVKKYKRIRDDINGVQKDTFKAK